MTISDTAAAAREAARTSEGMFGVQARTDPGDAAGRFLAAVSTPDGMQLVECDSPEEAELVMLLDDQRTERAHGDVCHVQDGSRTPWGNAQTVTHPAPGIAVVSCSGHGGVKLSKERNGAIPTALRRPSGWYEEDCESYIAMAHHPEGFGHLVRSGRGLDDVAEMGAAGCRDWFPDQWTAATGEQVATQDSHVLRDRKAREDAETYRQAHADDVVTTGAVRPSWCPAGYQVVTAEQRSTGQDRKFAVPEHFWSQNGTNRTDTPITIDPTRDADVTDISRDFAASQGRPRLPAVADLGVSVDHLTPAQAQRATKELGTRYRYPDGQVRTLAEGLIHQRATGKRCSDFDGNGRLTYYVELPDSRIQAVSKATYDALTGVPDTMSDEERAGIALGRAMDRLRRNGRSAQAGYDQAAAEYGRLRRDSTRAREEATARFKATVAERIAAVESAG